MPRILPCPLNLHHHFILLLSLLCNLPHFGHSGWDQTGQIYRNDQRRYKNPIWWKAYFAEMLAGSLILVTVLICICYCYYTGAHNLPVESRSIEQRRASTYNNYSHSPVDPAGYHVIVTSSARRPSFAKCSKPACACVGISGGEGGGGGGGRKSWKTWKRMKEQENEVYGPSKV